MTITGGPATPEVKSLPKHKKNSDVGEKQTVYSSTIFLEQEDAISFDDQEEVCKFTPCCVQLIHTLNNLGDPDGLGQCYCSFQDL